jgi:hypothetical protein
MQARYPRDTEAMNAAAEIRIRAQRRMGEELGKVELATGGGDQKSDHRSSQATGDRPTLAETGQNRDNPPRTDRRAVVCPGDPVERAAQWACRGGQFRQMPLAMPAGGDVPTKLTRHRFGRRRCPQLGETSAGGMHPGIPLGASALSLLPRLLELLAQPFSIGRRQCGGNALEVGLGVHAG